MSKYYKYPCEVCGGTKGRKEYAMCHSCRVKQNAENKIRICIDCQEPKPFFGRERCKSCYLKWYQSNHLERHAERERLRRANNPERSRQLDRNRNQTEKRKIWQQEHNQKYYIENKEALLKYQSEWRRADPIRRDNYKRRRRARELGLPDTLTEQEWQGILKAYDYKCAYCGKVPDKYHREHKTPASRGGGYTADNIVPSCPTCNLRKQRKTDEEFREYLAKFPR